MKKLFLILFIFLACPGTANAFVVVCTNCSDHMTQALEHVTGTQQLMTLMKSYEEVIQQTSAQLEMVEQNIKQYENMVQNTAALPANVIRKVSGQLAKVAAVTSRLNTIRSDVAGLGKVFDALYQSQDELKNLANMPRALLGQTSAAYNTTWDKWSGRVDEAAKATFQLSGSQLKELEDAGELDGYIEQLLSTPDGQQKAIMAGNQLVALQIKEARQLRELLATKIQSDLASQQKAEKERQFDAEHERRMLKTRIGTTSRPDPF